MANFEHAYEDTIRAEGGYRLTNIAGDRGGQTYAGIARKMNPTWPGWGHVDAGQVPPTHMVREFYKREFWDAVQGDAIDSQAIAATLYDFAVNAGVRVAVKLAQIVVNTTPDGDFGPATLAAINAADPQTFRLAYALAKVKRYAEIVNRNRTQSKFLLGWINRTLEGLS
jgi:lysozyme family protein